MVRSNMGSPIDEKRESPERLVFFSDAVVAIALTLLVIELPVPSADSQHAFFHSLQDNAGHYLAFLVSFVVVAVAWRNHKRMSILVTRADSTFETLNFVWLLTVVLMPFAAKLLTLHRHSPLVVHACCFGFYSLVQAAASGVLIVMLQHAGRKGRLEVGSERQVSMLQRTCLGFSAGFGLSIPFFFVTNDAWVLWIAVPFVLGMVLKFERARMSRNA
jgi:uncharacterized membrane protein